VDVLLASLARGAWGYARCDEGEADMTAKKDFKRRVRDRAARTGESYTAARAQVVSENEPAPDSVSARSADGGVGGAGAIVVEEMIDATAEAARLGFKCKIVATSSLARRVDWRVVLERLRDALLATEGDPTTDALRAVGLRGERPLVPKRSMQQWRDDLARFLKRARAGIGGTSDLGNMLALQVEGATVVCYTWLAPIFGPVAAERAPALSLTLLDDLGSIGSAALFARK
jgi:hypothetical protein